MTITMGCHVHSYVRAWISVHVNFIPRSGIGRLHLHMSLGSTTSHIFTTNTLLSQLTKKPFRLRKFTTSTIEATWPEKNQNFCNDGNEFPETQHQSLTKSHTELTTLANIHRQHSDSSLKYLAKFSHSSDPCRKKYEYTLSKMLECWNVTRTELVLLYVLISNHIPYRFGVRFHIIPKKVCSFYHYLLYIYRLFIWIDYLYNNEKCEMVICIM